MSNLLESNATTATTSPSYYTDYLSNLATKGTAAASNAQFAGAQPLQEKAFADVAGAGSAYKPTLEAAGQTLSQAAGSTAPLSAATPYLTDATSDPSQAAQSYMTPYIQSVVNALGDTGARNIRQNLSPLATAAAVGSGQFGSKRGAEVLGQTEANANRDILNAQSAALNTGYQNALTAATQQNQIAGQAGTTASNAADATQRNLGTIGTAQSQLAGQNQALGLSDVNALATLGGQQQTIAQNKENFPLTTLSTLSGLMAGQNIPTTQTQTASASPLSLLASGTTGLAGLFQPMTDANGKAMVDSAGNAITKYSSLMGGLSGMSKAAGSLYDKITGSDQTSANSMTIISSQDNEDGTTTDTFADGHTQTRPT